MIDSPQAGGALSHLLHAGVQTDSGPERQAVAATPRRPHARAR